MIEVKALIIKLKDNVATAIDDIDADSIIAIKIGDKIVEAHVKEKIPFGHKFALQNIAKGEKVVKYGEQIGIANSDIKAGEHVHIHNVESTRAKKGV